MRLKTLAAAAASLCLGGTAAWAAEGLDGRNLGLAWAIPFLGMLLSIAVFPLVAHRFWEHHPRQGGSRLGADGALFPSHSRAAWGWRPGGGAYGPARIHSLHPAAAALFTVAGGIVCAATSMARR